MSIPLPIEVKAGPLPLNFSGTWKQTYQALVPRLRGFVPERAVITGRNSGVEPTYDAGPWWINVGELQHWRIFDYETGRYAMDVKQVGSHDATVTLRKAPAPRPVGIGDQSKDVNLQDKTGTIALLSDVVVPRPVVILDSNGGTVGFNWADSNNFFILLTEDTTITQGAPFNGGVKKVVVENLGSTWNCDFEAAIKWPAGGAEPDCAKATDPSALGGYAISIFTFRRINGVTYGRFQDFSPANAVGTIDIGGDPPGNYGNTGSGAPQDGSHQRYIY